MRTVVYSLNQAEREALTASPLPYAEAAFRQMEADGLYRIANISGKRLLYKDDVCIMITAAQIPQWIMYDSAVLSAMLTHPAYLKEIEEAFTKLSE